jgi:hypothetical protein
MCKICNHRETAQYWIVYVKSGLIGHIYAPSYDIALAVSSAMLAFTGIPPQAVFVEPIGRRLFPMVDVGKA